MPGDLGANLNDPSGRIAEKSSERGVVVVMRSNRSATLIFFYKKKLMKIVGGDFQGTCSPSDGRNS